MNYFFSAKPSLYFTSPSLMKLYFHLAQILHCLRTRAQDYCCSLTQNRFLFPPNKGRLGDKQFFLIVFKLVSKMLQHAYSILVFYHKQSYFNTHVTLFALFSVHHCKLCSFYFIRLQSLNISQLKNTSLLTAFKVHYIRQLPTTLSVSLP